jgi:predicted ATPase
VVAVSLVAKSLVSADVDGIDAVYRLPETTRAYAWEKLAEAGDLEALPPHIRMNVNGTNA